MSHTLPPTPLPPDTPLSPEARERLQVEVLAEITAVIRPDLAALHDGLEEVARSTISSDEATAKQRLAGAA